MPQVTLELTPSVLDHARRHAIDAHQPVEQYLAQELSGWASGATHSVAELGRMRLSALADEQLTVLITAMAPPEFQERLSELLWRNSEGTLTSSEKAELDELVIETQLAGLLKARALLAWKERHGALPVEATAPQ